MERSLESRLFQAYWGDGTLDLVGGVAVVLIGLDYLFEQFLLLAVTVPLAFVGWLILRKRVVEPRAGYVEFARRRRQRSARELVGSVALGFGLLALFVALSMRARDGALAWQYGVDAVPAGLIALAAVVAAGLTRAWRFAAYAGLIAAAGVATVLLETGPAMPLLTGGIIVCATGAVLLVRFVTESRRFDDGR